MNLTDMNAINENIERMEQDNIVFHVVICSAPDCHISVPIKRMSKLAYEQESYDGLMTFTDGILKS